MCSNSYLVRCWGRVLLRTLGICLLLQVKKRGKTNTSKSNPKSIFYGRKFPGEWKTSASDISQSVAKTCLPPGASIWRSNFRGGSSARQFSAF